MRNKKVTLHVQSAICLVGVLLVSACCPSQTALWRGDFNQDGWVNFEDLLILAGYWLDDNPPFLPGSAAIGERLSLEDFAVMARHWQTLHCSPIAASASSQENASLSAANAVDGTWATRWSSAFADNQWLLLDMGQLRNVFGLHIFWEDAYAARYSIETSIDQTHWTQVYINENGGGNFENITFSPVTAQYVRINCLQRATVWGFSIYEVFVKTDDDCLAAGQWELVWSDEFDGPTIDSENWTFEIGTGSGGWGNGEWQYYTARPENARIENNALVIEARREDYANRKYTSARLKTQGKQSFQYGRIEARIKMPTGGHGIWPAFWMLGENITEVGWPRCGEIDIVEMMSNSLEDNRTASGAMHYADINGNHVYHTGSRSISKPLSDQFRIYAVEWDPTGISWYLDDARYFAKTAWTSSVGPFPAPFNQPFFILLNFAVGSRWWDPAVTEATVPFPQRMFVDYVRVYRKNQ